MKRFHLLTRLFIYLTNVQGAPIMRHGPSSGETAGNKSGDVCPTQQHTLHGRNMDIEDAHETQSEKCDQ